MAFDIGQEVVIATDITYSGEDLPTTGVSGTVQTRELLTITSDEREVYDYQVLLEELITAGSGTSAVQGNLFWFQETDIVGGQGVTTNPIVDASQASQALNTANNSANNSFTNITNIQNSVNTNSPYYDDIGGLLNVTGRHKDYLSGLSVPSQAETDAGNTTGRTVELSSDELGSDVLILEELAENMFGFYDVVNASNDQISQQEEQASIQQQLAFEDDVANEQAYQQAYVDPVESQDLIIPADQTENSMSDRSSQVDRSSIDEDYLTIPAQLDLEQD